MTQHAINRNTRRIAMARAAMNANGAGATVQEQVDRIIAVVAQRLRVTAEQIKSRSKVERVAFARQLAMTLAYEAVHVSSVEVGRCFERDHATVLHAVKIIHGATETQECARILTQEIREMLMK